MKPSSAGPARPENPSGVGGGLTARDVIVTLSALGVLVIPLLVYVVPWVNQDSTGQRALDGGGPSVAPVQLPDDTPSQPSPAPVDFSAALQVGVWVLIALVVVGAVALGGRVVVRARAGHRVDRAARALEWEAVRGRHAAARRVVASYETDLARAIDYPAFNDVTVPEVSAMVKAMGTAQDLESATDRIAPIGGGARLLSDYREAVSAFDTAVQTAERAARRIARSHLGPEEQQDLRTARHLLVQATDAGNTAEARGVFYDRLRTVIRRLNDRHHVDVIPGNVVSALESRCRPAVEPGH